MQSMRRITLEMNDEQLRRWQGLAEQDGRSVEETISAALSGIPGRAAAEDADPKVRKRGYGAMFILVEWHPGSFGRQEVCRRLYAGGTTAELEHCFLDFLREVLRVDPMEYVSIRRRMTPFRLYLLDGLRLQVAGGELTVTLAANSSGRRVLSHRLTELLVGCTIYRYQIMAGTFYMDYPAEGHMVSMLAPPELTAEQWQTVYLVYAIMDGTCTPGQLNLLLEGSGTVA